MKYLPPKKLAAVTAAISAYISQEQAAAVTASVPPPRPTLPSPSAWGLSARQETMQMRIMMQRRAFK